MLAVGVCWSDRDPAAKPTFSRDYSHSTSHSCSSVSAVSVGEAPRCAHWPHTVRVRGGVSHASRPLPGWSVVPGAGVQQLGTRYLHQRRRRRQRIGCPLLPRAPAWSNSTAHEQRPRCATRNKIWTMRFLDHRTIVLLGVNRRLFERKSA